MMVFVSTQLIEELVEVCKKALFELEHAHQVADDCYDGCDDSIKELLNDMLPAEDNNGTTGRLRAIIAQAEGGAR